MICNACIAVGKGAKKSQQNAKKPARRKWKCLDSPHRHTFTAAAAITTSLRSSSNAHPTKAMLQMCRPINLHIALKPLDHDGWRLSHP
jgi:hypothetical protein